MVVDPTRPFKDARFRATLAKLIDGVRQKQHTMFAFEAVRSGLHVRGQRALGVQTVLLSHIIGSEGRYRDFDRRFLPQSDVVKQRWLNIEQAMVQGKSLPPIDVYKISDVYFVRDGNHRVSVARYLGHGEIEARVIELLVEVELSPDLSMCTLLLQQERSDFLEWTNLHELRPAEQIVSDELGGYLDLIGQINRHRALMSQAAAQPVDRDEAVTNWYDTVYLPQVQSVNRNHLPKPLAARTITDIYRWMSSQSARLAG